MKKRLLLIALPALMVLSGCSNNSAKPVKEKEDLSNMMLEDTTAHEELFGASIDLNIRKIGVPDDDPGDTDIPRVGVQFSDVYERDVINPDTLKPTGDKVDCRAVRFVAAIKGDLSNQTAVWTRGVSETNSNQIKAMSGGHNSTEVYDSLNDGNVPTAVPTGYDHFVVYTMYDIPLSQNNSYIAAYVTLTPKAGGEGVKSAAVLTEIDGGHYFSVDMSVLVRNGYFLDIYNDSGLDPINTIAPEDNEGSTDTDPTDDEKDNSKFSNVSFNNGDKIGMFRLTSTVFQFYGFSSFMNDDVNHSAAAYIKSASINQYGEFYLSGRYTLFINRYNLVYASPQSVTTTLYFEPNSSWKEGGAFFQIWVSEWIPMTDEGEGIYSASVDVGAHSSLNFCRMNPVQNSGDGKNWVDTNGYRVWNQTQDVSITRDFASLVNNPKYHLNSDNPSKGATIIWLRSISSL